MQWVQIKTFGLIVSVCLFAIATVGFSAQPVSADAITGKNNDGLESQTVKWLRYRAIAKCFTDNDVGQNSYNDVVNGEFFDGGGVAIGYLNPDGKVSCDDGAFVKNTFGILGFGNTVDAFCSVQPMAQRFKDNFRSNDYSDTKDESNFEGCVSGAGDTLDMDSNALDQGARQLDQFKKGYAEYAGKNGFAPAPWDPSPAVMYHVYRSSLVKFCGATLIGKYNEADKNNIDADKRKVVVNDVDLGTGEIVRNVYKLTRDQTDKVDDIYVNANQQNVSNVTCSDMAQKTWQYDEGMSTFVKAYNKANPDDIGTGAGGGSDGATDDAVCSAGALGWIFCPLSNFMADAITGIAEFLEGFLIFEPITIGPKGDALRAIWGIVVVIANVGLIITFLFVAFSQATSIGISSYGIKKLLPKIIAAAVLINLSFYICAVAVDISNILGVSIKPVVEAGIAATNLNKVPDAQVGASFGQNAVVLTGIVMAGAIAIGTGAIALLIPILAAAFLAVITAFAIIAAREVILTLLIIIAPLAFLAAVLPNTESWFTKWRKLFTTMLLMFPMIMIIFYGSVLVSSLIMATHTNQSGKENISDLMVNLFAFAVLILPLYSLPFVMKSAGGVLDRLGVMVNNRNKGLVDRSRKYGQEKRANTAARFAGAQWGKDQNNMRGKFKRGAANSARFTGGYSARRDFKKTSLKADADRIQQNLIAEQLQDEGSKLAARSTLRGDTGQAIARARGVAIQDKAIGEEVSAARTVIENMQFTNEELGQLAVHGKAKNIAGHELSGDFYQKAAIQQFVSTGQTAKVHDMLANSQGMSQEVRENLAYQLQQNYSTTKAKDHSLNADNLKEALVKNQPITDNDLQVSAVNNFSGLTKEVMAGQDAKGIKQLKLAIQNNVGDASKRGKAIEVIREMMDDPNLAGRRNYDNEKEFNEILGIVGGAPSSGGPPPPPTPPPTPPSPPPTPPPAGGGAGTP